MPTVSPQFVLELSAQCQSDISQRAIRYQSACFALAQAQAYGDLPGQLAAIEAKLQNAPELGYVPYLLAEKERIEALISPPWWRTWLGVIGVRSTTQGRA